MVSGSRFSRLLMSSALISVLLPLGMVSADPIRIVPRFTGSVILTDNVNLTDTNTQNDIIGRFSPGVSVFIENSRISLQSDYEANFLYFGNTDDTDLRHSLFTRVNVDVIREHFDISGLASVRQTFFDRSLGFSSNQANRSGNRRTVQNYMISPRLKGRVAALADWSLTYSASMILSSADSATANPLSFQFSDTLTHSIYGVADTGDRFNRLRFTAETNYAKVDRDNANVRDFSQATTRGTIEYRLARGISILGSAGYGSSNLRTRILGRDGFVWDAGVRLTPSSRTSLLARFGRAGKRTTSTVTLNYRVTPRININGSYSDGLSSNATNFANINSSLNVNPDLGVVDQFDIPQSQTAPAFDFSDVDFRNKIGRLGFTWKHTRSSVYGNFSIERRSFDGNAGEAKSWGVSSGYRHDLDRKTNLDVNVNYRRNDIENSNREDHFFYGRFALNRNLSRYMTTGISYNYSQRLSNVANGDIKENSLQFFIRGNF